MGFLAVIPMTIAWRPNGLRFYCVFTSDSIARQYDVATAWTIAGANYVGEFDFSSDSIQPPGLVISDDGTKVWVSFDSLYEYTLSTAWDISTASLVQSEDPAPQLLTGSLSVI